MGGTAHALSTGSRRPTGPASSIEHWGKRVQIEMTQTVFGLTVPAAPSGPVAAALLPTLAARIGAAAATLQAGAPAAYAASVRQDAERYLRARRRGELRLPGGAAARACDEGALTLMRLTVDAPPRRAVAEPLVA